MSLSAFFLISFLLLHVAINLLSVVSAEMYNEASHFMGTNPIIQLVMQPILIFGVLFHFTMGFVLEFQNKSARPIKYEMKNEKGNSSWISRNMISGIEVSFIDATIDGSTTVVTARAGFTQAATVNVTSFSDIARIDVSQNAGATNSGGLDSIVIDLQTTMGELRSSIGNTDTGATDRLRGFNLLNLDVRSFNATGTFNVFVLNATGVPILHPVTGALNAGVGSLNIAAGVDPQSLTSINGTNTNGTNIATALFDTTAGTGAPDANQVGLLIQHVADTTSNFEVADAIKPIAVDFFSFGFISDGLEASQRVSNQIIRIEAEETGDNTSTFAGTLEYKMINQLNVLQETTYTGLSTIASDPTFIVVEDLTDEDAPRVNYLDLGADGVSTQIADQEEAPSHSGVVSFDSNNYKNADTVTITLEDLDLNVDSDLIDIYTVVSTNADQNQDSIGTGNATTGGFSITLSNGDELGRLLDITFDDVRWQTPDGSCTLTGAAATDTGLGATGFTLVESGAATGVFEGDFQIPNQWCRTDSATAETSTGLDIEVNYVDFRDASGEVIEVGDSAGVRANTGSISLDRTVYPVPFGVESDFTADTTNESPTGRALFPIHASGMNTAGTTRSTEGLQTGEFITGGDLVIHVRVNDPDFDTSASGEDNINTNSTDGVGPVKISVIRGSSSVILGYAGGDTALTGTIDTDQATTGANPLGAARAFGPMQEIAPDAGIFESDIVIRYTDGPSNSATAILGGIRVPVVGRVSMDLITLDVTNVPDQVARPGALVDLIGPDHSVDTLAREAGTIGYEILTALGPRFHQNYLETA
jgi:succinate dehydrogenase/fumarate reductase cytochrome b subunit